MATVITTISGIAASRLSSPTRSSAPQTNSADEARTALNPGAGMPSSVKKSVTLSRPCSLPQPVPMNTTPSVRRASVGPRKERRSAMERKRVCRREMRFIGLLRRVEETPRGGRFRYAEYRGWSASVTASNAAQPWSVPGEVFLASDESDDMMCTSMYVDGGMTLHPELASGG